MCYEFLEGEGQVFDVEKIKASTYNATQRCTQEKNLSIKNLSKTLQATRH